MRPFNHLDHRQGTNDKIFYLLQYKNSRGKSSTKSINNNIN